MSTETENKDLSSKGFYITPENGTLTLKNFSLKVDFNGRMTPKVLKNTASGLDHILTTAAIVLSDVTNHDLILEGISVGNVQSGSCGYENIALIIRETKNLIAEIKDMDYKKLLTICLTGLTFFSVDRFSQYKTAELAAESQTAPQGLITVKDSTIKITDTLNSLYPEHKDTIEKIVQAIVDLHEKSPRTARKFAKGLTEISHPGDIDATSVQFGTDTNTGEQTTQTLLTEEQISIIPNKMPPEEKEEPKPELCRNVQISIIKIDTESTADSAIQCRIVDEDYSNKKCPLIIHDKEMRQEIMNRFPANINVNLFALKQYLPSGEMKLKAYILKDILN